VGNIYAFLLRYIPHHMEFFMTNMSGKVAVITGAASGIGRETAIYFATHGAKVLVTDIHLDPLIDLCAQYPGEMTHCELDVTSSEQWQAVCKMAVATFGALDIVVNNAGIFIDGNIDETSYSDFKILSKINVTGTFLGVKTAIETFRKIKADNGVARGAIVNISSVAGIRALKSAGVYGASKAAVYNMTRAIAVECGSNGEQIRINSVTPGTIRTPMTESAFSSDYFDEFSSQTLPIPIGDYGTPLDVAAAVAFLASDEAEVITGADITIDGAWSAGLAGLNI
jgi:NAD(P)-dependent dehydrogenase (short-subunit alcohol dehydrogenase family)